VDKLILQLLLKRALQEHYSERITYVSFSPEGIVGEGYVIISFDDRDGVTIQYSELVKMLELPSDRG
jgi:hypothetical protein